MSEIEGQVAELEEQVETITTERDTAVSALDEAKKKQAIAEAKSIIDKAISEAELPDPSKTRLTERFADAETADGIEEAIEAEVTYIGELAESGKVKGMGATVPDAEADKKALREAAKRLNPGATDEELDTFVKGR